MAQPAAVQPVHHGGSGLAITSMVLGIVSVVLFIVWFVALPLAITAVVLGIISLVKRRPGKGMSIAGLATGGFALLLAAFFAVITLVAYVGINQRANESQRQAEEYRIQRQEQGAEAPSELFN